MKWYLHTLHRTHLEDIKVKRGQPIEDYYPWVIQIANTFTRESVAIGALNLQDLIQAGYVGLVEAWNNVDHERGQAEKWSFIKKRIKGAVRRDIDSYGSFIKVPRRQLEENRKRLTGIDKILVDVFPKFFEVELRYTEDIKPWRSEQLQDLLEDYLYSNYKMYNVNILFDSFGIDIDNPLTFKELSVKYKKPEGNLRKIKQRILDSLKEDLEFKEIIEKFNQN